MRVLRNPYYIFSIIWLACLCFYLLGWSEFFPPISIELLFFLLTAVALLFIFGLCSDEFKLFKLPYYQYEGSNITFFMLANVFLWIIQFAICGVPLLYIVRGIEYNYQEFGIPTVKVVITTLNGFLSVYAFSLFLTSRKKKFLFYSILCLSFFLMAYSRGLVISNGVSIFFLTLLHNDRHKIKVKQLLFIIIGISAALYLFGVAGNIRVMNQVAAANNTAYEDMEYSSNEIMDIGKASNSFRENIVPGEYFWSYLYICSPISNLQYNLDKKNARPFSIGNGVDFFINEIMFDFISKRINDLSGKERLQPKLLIEALTVCTTFAGSYCYLGWVGLIAMLLFLLLFPVFFLFLLGKRNRYYGVAIAVLCSMYFFSFFDNMFSYAGLSPQLLYPFIFPVFDKLIPLVMRNG